MNTPYPKAISRYPTIRQSILSAFDLCALEAKFDIQYRQGWATHPMGRGSLFHEFAARALREMNAQGENTIEVDVALAILYEVLRQDDVDRECPECGTGKILKGVHEGLRTCKNGHRFETEIVNVPDHEIKDLIWTVKKWAADNHFDTADIVDVEHRLKATITYPGKPAGEVERVLTGQLDVLLVQGDYDEAATVLDWKDTWALPPQTEVSFEGYFQQRFYAFLIFKQPMFKSVERVTLREFYVRRSEPREATIWRSQLDEIEHGLAALVERFDRAVQEDLWTPTPGHHCSWCPRPTACPIPPFVRGAGRLESQKQADDAARQLIVAEAIVSQNKAALSAWASRHGPVPIRDAKGHRVWGHRETKRINRPTKDEAAAVVSASASVEEARERLAGLYREQTITRFEPHVPPKERETEADELLLSQMKEAVDEAKARAVA